MTEYHLQYMHTAMKGFMKIFTYGCQMNDLDTQKLYSELFKRGYARTEETTKADIIILNTCSVRQKAQEKAFSNLGRLKPLKNRKPSLIIAVVGCVAQQEGTALIKRMPHVDIVLGTHQLHRLSDILGEVRQHKAHFVDTMYGSCIPSMDIVPDKSFMEPPHRAYINIMQGCNNYCSYCIVPYVRGREISRNHTSILDEVRLHAARGVKEIFLLGQNVNSYAGGVTFPALLKEVHTIEGIERIRFTTSHPKDVNPEFIGCFAKLAKICSHIHLPFQAGSDTVLKAMNRDYTKKGYLELIHDLSEARADIVFSADVMVGFPGETQGDFEQTLDLMQAVRFDVLYSFKYSPRPKTFAAGIEDSVTLEEKRSRLHILQTLQNTISLEINQARVGRVYDVLVDGTSPRQEDQVYGRTTHNTIVNFNGSPSLIGTTVRVRVLRANKNSLTGELLRP